jgi:drug/metabolite transporter (DMT)-like permease
VILSFIGAMLVITKGNIQAFLGATDHFIPFILILLAVIGWVIYTMGVSEFSGWSVLRYSTLSCLLGTVTAIVITIVATLFGFISAPAVESIKTVSPHLLFMIVFPGVIALLGWNIGVSILSPLNGLLFINFVPITTLLISIFQGNPVTSYDILGTIFIIVSLLSNNIFVRMLQRKESNQHVQTYLHERAS